MPNNTDPSAQNMRRKGAWQSACLSSLWLLLVGGVLVWLRKTYLSGTFGGSVLLIIAILDLGSIIPIWILLKTRLKEIEGGEEDAAAQY